MDQPKDSSLKEFLRRPNQFIESIEATGLPDDEKKKNQKEKRHGKAKTRCRSYSLPRVAREWAGFSLEAFNSVYSDPLHQVLALDGKFNNYPTELGFPFYKIVNEDCLETLLIKSNHSIICEALSFAQTHIQECNSHDDIYASISDS